MAGHSKWSQIKHKKAKNDAKRGQEFTRLIKEITVVARAGGGDPAGNAHLRLLLEKAKEINMPQDNAMRAIKRGTGELPGVSYEAMSYEGYGPHGIAVMVDALTDNKNRTVAELRRIFTHKGGNLGETGSVNWMFERKGVIRATGNKSEDELLEALLLFDISDIDRQDNTILITCEVKALEQVKHALTELGLAVKEANIEWLPKNTINLSDEQSEKVLDFLNELDDHEDVQNVYTNLA
ncbi:YebC/PmpR family DNA-binding transcriptional regulator [Candidatus Dependentiae bacterium]|nr:YebC/PmpR family DNA-binding transcriptional regulator [Candidatus Dependentiae bacterium]